MGIKLLFYKDRFARIFIRRYLIFLLIFIGTSYFLVSSFLTSLESQRYYGSMINIVGKQRMLVQRIIYLAYNIVHCDFKEEGYRFYEDRLEETLYEFGMIHQNVRDQMSTFARDSSVYVLYFGTMNLSYQIESFIDSAYRFLETSNTADRKDILEKMWLKWGGDMGKMKEMNDQGYGLDMQVKANQYLPLRESLSELLEAATFNMQLLGESHLKEIKQFALWSSFILIALIILNACLVVLPLLIAVAKKSDHPES